tara:strand:- start:197 stop:934 length:738 start_codon:yes stop_codon:yes gene_type:complete
MKLDAKKLKQLISEAMKERQGETMLLEEPVSEMATGQSVADRIDPNTRPERTAEEFVIMSSDRGERSDPENRKMYGEFKQKVKSAGFPFTEFVGSWEETDEESEEKRRVTENSLIIYSDKREDVPEQPEGLFELGRRLSAEYNQEAFIYGELVDSKGGPSRLIRAFNADGDVIREKWAGPWSSVEDVERAAPFWSAVRGSGKGAPFQLKEDQDYVEVEAPNSVIEAMKKAHQHKGKKIRFVRSKN